MGAGGPPPGVGGPPPGVRGAGGPPPGARANSPLAVRPVGDLMLKFAIPSIIGMLVSSLYNMVDQLFIGRSVGPLGNAATSIAFPFTTVCMAIALLFGIGGASAFNLTLGMGDKEKAPYYIGNSLSVMTLAGIAVSVLTLIFIDPLLHFFGSSPAILPYAKEYVSITAIGFPMLIISTAGGHIMRADGSPHMTMISSITGAVLNTVLDAIFVFGFHWGMRGAALATVIGQTVSTAIVLIYCTNYKTVPLGKEHLLPSLRWVSRIASIGMASCFNQLANAVVQIAMNNSLRHYGELSKYGPDEPIACAGIVMKVNMIVFSIVIGLAQGTQPIESFNYGAKNYDRVKQAFFMALKVGAAISIAAFIFFQIFPKQILGFFGKGSENYYEFGAKYFRIFMFLTWFNCLQPITSTFFTSIGKAIKGLFLSLTRQIIFFLPLLFFLPLIFGIDGILFTGPIADLIAGIFAIAMAAVEFKEMDRLQDISDFENLPKLTR
ncbi:MAG: MATE family efflux transporter [Ruminococcus sp.]|nr:MATE family efflux transporter [Ruminococcus sp.]